jgi:dTDP-4-dehydrorhamnose 3,5-epimerase
MKNKKFDKNILVKAKIFNTNNFKDHRGNFKKIFSKKLLSFLKNYKIHIKEINYCYSKKKGTIRGMHFQVGKYKEDKIITCLKGKIFDVVIDLRKKSKNFLKCQSFILNENSNKSLFVPKGFAHGYQSITDKTEILYLVTSKYSRKHEGGINPLSKFFNIKWPIKNKILSKKDKKLKKFQPNFKGF